MLGTREVRMLGLVTGDVVQSGYVVRMPKAYPVYNADYAGFVATIREWIGENAPNVHPVGRNGMHKYNNQDHSMLTAQLTVKNILGAAPAHDIWSVNVEDDYHEEQTGKADHPIDLASSTGREAPLHPRKGTVA